MDITNLSEAYYNFNVTPSLMDPSTEDGVPIGLLTEQELRYMSRHSKGIFFSSKDQHLLASDIKKSKDTLDALFRTAEDQNINAPHRVAAWNTLCAFIDLIPHTASLEHDTELSLNIVCFRTLDLYIESSHKARPKSCKQLLTTLASALRRCSANHDIRDNVSDRLLRCIINNEIILRTKPSLQALSHFLSKEVLPLDDVFSAVKRIQGRSVTDEQPVFQELLSIFLKLVNRNDLGSVVAQVVSTVLDKLSTATITAEFATGGDESNESRLPVWALPVEAVIYSGEVSIDDLESHILPALFRRDTPGYVRFLYQQGLHQLDKEPLESFSGDQNTEMRSDLLYAALRIGKQLGLLYEHDGSEISVLDSSILLPTRSIGRLLPSSSRRARLTGLSLLVTSHSMTRPISNASLKLIRHYLHIFFADTDANFRSEVFSLLQRLLDRLRAITMVLARESALKYCSSKHKNSTDRESLDQYRDFIEWLLRFLAGELRPTANYQRHISALKAISIIARCGLDNRVPTEYWSKAALGETYWPFHMSVMSTALQRLLLDLLMDPFDDVRQTSASILAMYSGILTDKNADTRGTLSESIRRGEELMLRTGRADHADGVAHLYALFSKELEKAASEVSSKSPSQSSLAIELLDKLDYMIEIAGTKLSEAVTRYPIHGLLTSLRYLLTHCGFDLSSQDLLDRLVRSLQAVWTVAKTILCNDAPEGYVPGDFDEVAESTSKDTLSYCWRALKESSLLLETIVSKISSRSHETLLLLGDLSFTQLAELRHRGAFSTVAQTWVTCCVKCHSVSAVGETSPIQIWYERVLEILANRSQINTRRSAGLPALICGLLISDRTGGLVSLAFTDLSTIAMSPVGTLATDTGSLSQVHALNCIKDILKNTRLREHSEHYVPQALHLAAQSLRSQAWAIRNCGLMLFRAVIDRLLGTSDAHFEDHASTMPRLTFSHHVDVLNVILDLLITPTELNAPVEAGTFEGVFPALQLLQRTHVPPHRLELAMSRVLALTTSASWHVREKAARTYASFVSNDAIAAEIKGRLGVPLSRQNVVHGALACVKHLLRRLRVSRSSHLNNGSAMVRQSESLSSKNILYDCAASLTAANHLYNQNECVITRAAYVDVLIEFCERVESFKSNHDGVQDLDIFKSDGLDVLGEIRKTLDASHARTGDGVLRAGWSRALGTETRIGLLGSHEVNLVQSVRDLAKVDPGACILFFEEIRSPKLLETLSVTDDMISSVACELLAGNFETNLKCEVQRVLLDMMEQYSIEPEKVRNGISLIEVSRNSSALPCEQSTQLFADQWLQLRLLTYEYRVSVPELGPGTTPSELINCIDDVCLAVEEQTLFSREAAAEAISRPKLLWRYLGEANRSLFCRICFSVYDLLNDDNESIRLLASQTASRITSCGADMAPHERLEPGHASTVLVRFMIQKWGGDSALAQSACIRAFGLDAMQGVSVSGRLKRLEETDDALFAEEKQNLYIDEARETKVWAEVLLKIEPTAIPPAVISSLARWVFDGLESLISKANSNMDGSLGWSSKVEAFNLILQVVSGVQILLHWVLHNIRLPVRPSSLRLRLGQLNVAATTCGMNPLLVREIDSVMTSAVLGTLRRCKSDLAIAMA